MLYFTHAHQVDASMEWRLDWKELITEGDDTTTIIIHVIRSIIRITVGKKNWSA